MPPSKEFWYDVNGTFEVDEAGDGDVNGLARRSPSRDGLLMLKV